MNSQDSRQSPISYVNIPQLSSRGLLGWNHSRIPIVSENLILWVNSPWSQSTVNHPQISIVRGKLDLGRLPNQASHHISAVSWVTTWALIRVLRVDGAEHDGPLTRG